MKLTNAVLKSEMFILTYEEGMIVRFLTESLDFQFSFSATVMKTKDIDLFLANQNISQDYKDYIRKYLNGVVTNHKQFMQYGNDLPGLATRLPGVNQVVVHPVTKSQDTLYTVIISLNDSHKWSRDAIADFIESLDEVPVFEAPKPKAPERSMIIRDDYPVGITLISKRERLLSRSPKIRLG